MGRNDGISEYCRADDGSWVICKWENALWVPERREWLDCWRVTVQLPEGVASPWFPDLESVSAGITFNTYDEAWAHVSRSDLMVWALTEHARDLSNAVVHWRRRTYDLDPDNRAPGALKDIRCAILDTGWPLGDDSDPEMTPVRLVKEILAAKETAEKAGEARFRDAVVSFLTDEIKQYARRKREAPLSLSLADSCANTAKLHIRGVVRDLLLTEKGSTPEQLSVARARSRYHLETE